MNSPKHSPKPQSLEQPYPGLAYAWYVVGVLFLITLLSQLDRQLPALLVRPIRSAFGISDTQLSLLQGYAFALCYTLTGLPLGRLVDRSVRRRLIFWGMLFWCAMTALSAVASSYGWLLLARMGVGVGEAVLSPAAYSMIADYFAPARRGRALAIYYTSLAAGSGASLLLGAWLLAVIPKAGMAIPGLDMLAAWRVCFLAAAVPGVAMAMLLFSVREPARHGPAGHVAPASVRQFLAYLRGHRATFARLLTYPATLAIIGYSMLAWAPAVFERRFGMPTSRSGVILGILIAAPGVAGTLLSGVLSDRWSARGVASARLRVACTGTLICAAPGVLWPLASDAVTAFALLGAAIFGLGIAQSAAPASIQEVVPNRMRGQAIAVYLLIAGLLGIGLGPMLVALVSDSIFHDSAMLPQAISCTVAPVSLLAIWLCWSGLRPYAATRAAMDA